MSATIKVIDRDGSESSVLWEAGSSLMEALRDNDLPLLASCGGCCSCATCHVFLSPDFAKLSGESAGEERELLEQTEAFQPEVSRLSCQIAYADHFDGLTVKLAPEE